MTVNRERGTVKFEIETITYELDGSLENAIATLTRIREQHPDACVSYGDVDSYSDNKGLVIYKYVPETDKQMAERIANEERYAKYQEERERAQLAALQAKYSS